MPMHTYPSWVVHIPKMGIVASTWWTQRMPQKWFTDRRTDGQSACVHYTVECMHSQLIPRFGETNDQATALSKLRK